jgi:hypothetical protein
VLVTNNLYVAWRIYPTNGVAGVQPASANLTNWSGLATGSVQPATAGLTNISNGDAVTLTNISSSGFRFETEVPQSAPTNFVCDLSQKAVYRKILATNNIFFVGVTNAGAGGPASYKIRPNGADRVITWPTNFCTITNTFMSQSGPFWNMYLTNGARIAWISLAADGNDMTNVVISGGISQ